MVYGRHRTRNGRRTPAPQDQWLWSPAPVHPAIVDRATWDAAQDAAGGHGTSRDGDEPNSHPATARSYPYRSRIRCRDCRRMAGTTYGHPAAQSTYYRCPHNPATPRHAASCPDHPRTVQAPELLLDQIIGQFFADRIFGPGRAALLAAQLPATDADATAAHDAQAAQLQARIKRIETAQNSQILELEQLPADPADTASAAMRARIRARFADLHHEREQIDTQLTTLAKTTPAAAGPALLDQLPLAGDIQPGLPAPRPQSPPVHRVRPGNPVEQTRPASHRVRRDHREHPPGHPRHPEPQPGRLPRHRQRWHPRRPARTHVGSGQHP